MSIGQSRCIYIGVGIVYVESEVTMKIDKKKYFLGGMALCVVLLFCLQVRKGGNMTVKQVDNERTFVSREEQKKIALTFDDGPSALMTPQLLDGLKERKVVATFFVLGEAAEQNPELILRMKEEGHLIGNHTYHHVQLTAVSEAVFKEEIRQTNEVLKQITGEEPQFIRPPFGAWRKSLEKELGMIPVLWDVDPLDWCRGDCACIVEKVMTDVEENAIILLHDQYESSVTAAFQIIDRLKEKGYEFVTVEELILN